MKKKQILTDDFMHTFREVVKTILSHDSSFEQEEGYDDYEALLNQIYYHSGLTYDEQERFSRIIQDSLDDDYGCPK